MHVELLARDREEEYSEVVLRDERALFNCSLTFRELLRRVTGAQDCYLVAVEGSRIVGTLPAFLKENPAYGNVLNSLPWYGSNPGICVDPASADRARVKTELIRSFHELAQEKRAITSTLITRPFERDQELYRRETRFTFLDSRIGMMTTLPQAGGTFEPNLMSMLHSKTRNLVRKAQRSSITIRHDDSASTLHFLADLHRRNMEAVGGPPKELAFFETLTTVLVYDRDYRVYVAEMDGARIAALLLTYFCKTVCYFTPAIEAQYRTLQPMNLLILTAMRDAAEKNFRYWNWGGTLLPSQAGVYHFKKRWGSDECTYWYYTRAHTDTSRLLSTSKETLMSEYPYFYVLPFSALQNGQKEEQT